MAVKSRQKSTKYKRSDFKQKKARNNNQSKETEQKQVKYQTIQNKWLPANKPDF
jgi:hypothetical protein